MNAISCNFLGCHWLEHDYRPESQGNYRSSSCCRWLSMPKPVEHEIHTYTLHTYIYMLIIFNYCYISMHQWCVGQLAFVRCSMASCFESTWLQRIVPKASDSRTLPALSRDEIHWRFISIQNWGRWQAGSCKYQRHVAASVKPVRLSWERNEEVEKVWTFCFGNCLLRLLPHSQSKEAKSQSILKTTSSVLSQPWHFERIANRT